MASLTINICGRSYDIACEDGQQEHVTRLAHAIDLRAQGILHQVGQVGEARLLVMLCLVLQDEIADLKASMPVLGSGEADELQKVADAARASLLDGLAKLDGQVAGSLDALAERVEAIAERLAKP
jgi:cell division protein ZapA